VEGGNHHNDWWAWEAEGHIEGGARSGQATDHWNRFREDIRLASELGLNSYRFSIEWSRLEPERGRWDPAAFEWYAELVSECEKRGLLPNATLHHFTSPRWFAEAGGFTNARSPELFAAYASRVARRLGARIPLWCTFNEPMVLAAGTYLGFFMPPATYSPQKASDACHHLLRAHVLAYDTIHARVPAREGPWRSQPLAVGIAHNMLDFLPDRKWHLMEVLLTELFRRFYNRAWLDAVTGRKQHFGVPGLVPYARPVKEALGRNTVDYIGINYYTKAYVQWRPRDAAQERPAELPLGLEFARRKETTSDVGWATHPAGLGRMIRFASRYGLPLYVTENGIADREDKLRGEHLLAHLREIARAIERGADVRGYYHWSLLDNFEWIKGFGPRFGLYRVDYSDFARTRTGSAELYREVIERHRGGPPRGELLGGR
jgi:beta-glucosidase